MNASELLAAVEGRECRRLESWAENWMPAGEARDLVGHCMGRLLHEALAGATTEAGPLGTVVDRMLSTMELNYIAKRYSIPSNAASYLHTPLLQEHEDLCRAYAVLSVLGEQMGMDYVDRLAAETWFRIRRGVVDSFALEGARRDALAIVQPFLDKAATVVTTGPFSGPHLYGWGISVFERELDRTCRRWPFVPPPRSGG